MKTLTTFKNTELKFKLNEEFEQITGDDRKTKVNLNGVMCSVYFSKKKMTLKKQRNLKQITIFT